MRNALRLHRYPAALAAWLVLLVVGYAFSQRVDLPSADGPRFAREMVLAIAPSLLGIVSLPVVGDLGLTLWRDRWLARSGALTTVGGTLALGGVLWPRGGVSGAGLEYEVALVLFLSSASVLLARGFGTHGLLVSSVASLLVCLYWNGVARLLGFGGTDILGAPWLRTSWRGHASLAVACLLSLAAVLGDVRALGGPRGD